MSLDIFIFNECATDNDSLRTEITKFLDSCRDKIDSKSCLSRQEIPLSAEI